MARILQIFNRYLHMGGEEKSVDRIYRHLAEHHTLERCFFDSRSWQGPEAPSRLSQLRRLFYNEESKRCFHDACDAFRPDVALVHNVYPVGSSAIYHAAQERSLPIIHYIHNFRPFSVGGTLYSQGGAMLESSLQGNYWPEIRQGSWQGSRLKSLIMAAVLKRLHRSGWLRQVKAWVCISDFMRQKIAQAGIPQSQLHTLRHSWDPLAAPPTVQDSGAYLFLARLIPEKGVTELLQTWQSLEQKLQDKTPLLQIGGEGSLATSVKEAAARSSKIEYLGLIQGTAKEAALQRCRAMLAPSTWWEPLGLVTYEAYDYAKPMLAAASGGLTETVQDSVTGFLYPPGDPAALAQVILRMESLSPEARLAMGQAGRAWLLQHTSVSSWQQDFAKILHTIPGIPAA